MNANFQIQRFNTIKNQILFGFIIISIIVGIIVLTSYRFTNRLEIISNFKENIESINRNIYYLMYIDNRVLNENIIDSSFYLNESTLLLDEHTSFIEMISNQLHTENFNEQFDADLTPIINTIQKDISRYDSLFTNAISLYRIRGFKDYGLEGVMRDYAHDLEKYSATIKLEDLLSLRRHEKDYFLRNDSLYKVELNNRSAIILRKLNTIPQSANLIKVINLLEGYTKKFNEIYTIEQKIGDKDFGLVHELSICQSDILRNLVTLRLQATTEAKAYQSSIYYTYWTTIIVCIVLGLLLSVVIARLLAKPIRTLAEIMEKPLREQIESQELDKEISTYSSLELIQLQTAFQKLLETIHDQIGQISVNNELLSTQNDELTIINEKLANSESRLQETLTIKDKFFSIIAHDLRGPMASLTSFLKMFIEYNEHFSKEETREFAQKMQYSTENLSNLLENLLTWSRAQMGKINLVLTKVDVEKIVDQNFKLFSEKASAKNIQLKKLISTNELAWTDANVLEFALRNLLSNAIKFSHAFSEVNVLVSSSSKKTIIKIKDRGVGMTEEQQYKLFNPKSHFTTQGTANEKGTGLGIMLCKDFIEKVGGKLSVESVEGEGTTFTILVDEFNPTYHSQKNRIVLNY